MGEWTFDGASFILGRFEFLIVSGRASHGDHVDQRSHCVSPADDGSVAFELAAVVIEWGHAHHGGDLLVVEVSQFRQVGNEGACCCAGEPRHTLDYLALSLPNRGLIDDGVNDFLDRPGLPIEALNVGCNHSGDHLVADLLLSNKLLGSHLQKLSAACT